MTVIMAMVEIRTSCNSFPDMRQLELNSGEPVIPAGYRQLNTGEAIEQGDMWADMEFVSWEPALSWKRGAIAKGGICYIRAIPSDDLVPLVQQ